MTLFCLSNAFVYKCIRVGAGYRERLLALPWVSADGERRTVDVQSIGGNDLGRRLKELEDENAQLKRQQSELHLQLMEQSENHVSQSLQSDRTCSVASTSEDSEDQNGTSQAMSQLRAKTRDLEKEITSYKQKEMEWEKCSLEMEGRIKRIQADGETHTNTITELHQRIAESQETAGAMRVLSEKYQAEMETIKAQLDAEVTENRSKLEGDMSSLQGDVEKATEGLKEAMATLAAEREELTVHKQVAEERQSTINQLRDQMLCLETAAASARDLKEHFDGLLAESKSKLEEMTSERDVALQSLEERDARIESLQTELKGKDEDIAKLEAEKDALLSDSVAPEEYLAMEEKALKFEGERNQLEKMTKSLQKDMKKVVKELQHQIWLVEEDLARSNERCEELRGVMTQMADDDLRRIEEEESKRNKSGLMGKMKSIRRQSSTPNPVKH